MNRKLALLVSTFLSIFILVMIAGVITTVRAAQNSTAAAATANTAVNDQLAKTYADREAQYQQLLAEANQRLEQANQALANQQQASVAASPVSAAAPQVAVSVQQAIQIAQTTIGSSVQPQATPELVNYQNTPAYEVVFDTGKLYVDASTGKVLFNGVQKQITQDDAGKIAVDYLKGGKVYQIVTDTFQGSAVYKVTFWAGYIVDVDMTGQVVYVKMVKSNTVNASLSGGGGGGGGGGAPAHHGDDGGSGGGGDD